jgi:hypothetical protein
MKNGEMCPKAVRSMTTPDGEIIATADSLFFDDCSRYDFLDLLRNHANRLVAVENTHSLSFL